MHSHIVNHSIFVLVDILCEHHQFLYHLKLLKYQVYLPDEYNHKSYNSSVLHYLYMMHIQDNLDNNPLVYFHHFHQIHHYILHHRHHLY